MATATAVTEVVQRTNASVRRHGLVLAVIVACQLMLMLDTTVMTVVLPRIQAQLRFSPVGLSWVMSAYTLVYGGLLLLGGRAGSPAWLILARAAQGVGAAAAGPSALALLATTFTDPRARLRAFSVYTGVGSSGIVLGLVIGGLLTQLTSWRSVLFINVPVGVAVIVLAARFVAEPPRVRAGLDLPGALTGTAGLAAIVYGAPATAFTIRRT